MTASTVGQHPPIGDGLRAAAERIREVGLAKGATRRADGSMCALGAISWATGESGFARYCAGRGLMLTVIGTEWVAEWNDAPERTADEVIAALEAAADLADAEARQCPPPLRASGRWA